LTTTPSNIGGTDIWIFVGFSGAVWRMRVTFSISVLPVHGGRPVRRA
jgi:hypothetical protein